MSEPYLRCTQCGAELTKDETRGLKACPRCGTTSVPMAIADDVTVEVNWHELRILGIWAEQWAAHHAEESPWMQRTVARICGRLQAQHPDKTAPLIMSGELAQVRQEFGDLEVRGFHEDAEANDPEGQ